MAPSAKETSRDLAEPVGQSLHNDAGSQPVARVTTGQALAIVAAMAIASAGVIHFAAAAPHLKEYWLFGGAFYAMAATQETLALLVAIARRARWLLVTAIGLNFALCVLWAVTRTVGLPLGPEHWKAEAVGFADLACVALQIVAVLLLWPLASARPRIARLAQRPMTRAVLAGALLVTIIALVPLVSHASRTVEGGDNGGMISTGS